jgi:ADP-heptose:LPS heptosyltransferase
LRWAASTRARNGLRLGLLRLAGRALRPATSGSASIPRKVLVLRPDHVGDVLLSAPAVALLRTSLPAAQLTYIVGPWSAEAARHGPVADDLRTFEFPGFTRRANANLAAPYALLMSEAAALRREEFDLAVILRGDHWWGALLALVAGIPLRVGGATPETTPLLTHAYQARALQPAAEQALGIVSLALSAVGADARETGGVVQFEISDAAQQTADSLWRQHGLGQRRVVAIHPNAGAPLKSWPHERWAVLADALSDLDVDVVLVGAPGDAVLLNQIEAAMSGSAPRLCGQSLEVSAAIYARCALVVSVDSGAGHLAAAVGTPTVRVYGPVPATVFGPWPPRVNQQVLATSGLACAPCGSLEDPPCGAQSIPACMLAVQVEDVFNAARVELNRS